jgi:hypothetical protein
VFSARFIGVLVSVIIGFRGNRHSDCLHAFVVGNRHSDWLRAFVVGIRHSEWLLAVVVGICVFLILGLVAQGLVSLFKKGRENEEKK